MSNDLLELKEMLGLWLQGVFFSTHPKVERRQGVEMKIFKQFKLVGLGLIIIGLISLTGNAFKVSVHKEITEKALGFLMPHVLEEINDEHGIVDDPTGHFTYPEYHFDDCRFKESTENINSSYDKGLEALDPARPDGYADKLAKDIFGRLLHTVQDFYAHSNWVDLVEAGHLKGLVDKGIGKWPVLEGWRIYKDEEGNEFIVAQGEEKTIPKGWKVEADPKNKKIIWVTTDEGQKYPGLISGTWWITGGPEDDCYDKIALSHAELNKDDLERPGYETAYNLALQQTKAEWGRLEGLMKARYGEKGYRVLKERFLGIYTDLTITTLWAEQKARCSWDAEVRARVKNLGLCRHP